MGLLSTKELSVILNIGAATIAKKAKNGSLPSKRVGGHYFFDYNELLDFWRAKREQAQRLWLVRNSPYKIEVTMNAENGSWRVYAPALHRMAKAHDVGAALTNFVQAIQKEYGCNYIFENNNGVYRLYLTFNPIDSES